jgi:FKBP-type peptidyl-prolyl cis-trans isomerase
MLTRILPIAILGVALISNTGCNSNNGGFKKAHGIEYKIVKDAPGKNAQMGDIVEFNLIAKADTTELGNTYKQGKPGVMRVSEVKNSGDLQAVFPYLSVGDSAIVQISCDSIIKSIPPAQLEQAMKMQPWMKKGKKIVINLSVVSIKSMEDYKKDMDAKQAQAQQEAKAKAAVQMPIDDKTLQEYFAKNNIKAQKTASGLYYTIQKPGSGAQIAKGQSVSMMYNGKTLDGKIFDSNIDTSISHHGEPLVFTVGQGQMIPGVDEGVGLLKKGTKATLYLPSPLAYGAQSPSPNVAPNSILIFEVEITEVKAASPQKTMQMPRPAQAPKGGQ